MNEVNCDKRRARYPFHLNLWSNERTDRTIGKKFNTGHADTDLLNGKCYIVINWINMSQSNSTYITMSNPDKLNHSIKKHAKHQLVIKW